MFTNDDDNTNKPHDPPDTLLRENVNNINGTDIVVSTETYLTKPDGSEVRQTRNNYQMAKDGRWFRVDEFVALSWTGLLVPYDMLASCSNPFDIHAHRLVYLDIDGFVTDFGNVLCKECLERNEKRQKLKKLMCLGLFYNPEEY